MPVEVALGTPLAEKIQNAVQSKLAEAGWGGLDDSGLSEYILLMVINGKTQAEVASELTTDLLDVGPEDAGAVSDFSRWLFEQVEILGRMEAGEAIGAGPTATSAASADAQMPDGSTDQNEAGNQDAMMDDAATSSHDGTIPTGPKSMRNGAQSARGGRMLGHLNKAMDRTTDSPLHRIKGTASTGRINSHSNRDTSKGSAPKGPRASLHRNIERQNRNNNGMNMAAMNSMGMNPMNFMQMSPEEQARVFADYAQMAGMMANTLMGAQGMNPMMMGQQPMQPGKSLFDRVEPNTRRHNGKYNNRNQHHNQANGQGDGMDLSSSMEVESSSQAGGSKPDPATTMCHFNLTCTKPDCPFVHQSPAAPPQTAVDMSDECSFGAACKNRKCVGKHPSPAKRDAFQGQQDCKFWPYCTNPRCPFKHPSAPPCRNGGDCKTEGCTFAHNRTPCKFTPCKNPVCPYKHEEGQKQEITNKVWINPENEEAGEGGHNHVSERKFVNENAEEELIIPDKADGGDAAGNEHSNMGEVEVS